MKVTGVDGGAAKDGTKVDMAASLGRVEPADVRTQDGEGRVGYHAGGKAGSERVTAVSGTARTDPALSVRRAILHGPGTHGDARVVGRRLRPEAGRLARSRRVELAGDVPHHQHVHRESAGVHSPHQGRPWPVKDGLEGNPWIFVNMNGKWYGATFEWLAPGQQCKGIHAGNIGEHIGRSPLSSWRPRSGELVGLMVSARARFQADTVRERSNVVMVRWP